jgi:hypothetical protein
VPKILAATALLCLITLGCSPQSRSARAPLTERQRDSVLAQSALPGASVVGRALDASDRAADRAAGVQAADSLFR